MRLMFAGPQGSGKGTIGSLVGEALGIPVLSMGKLLREIPESSEHYEVVNKMMEEGVLVPHEIAGALLRERTAQDDCANGYILDGYPRSLEQLDVFDPEYDRVIILNISRETTLKRITGRRVCSSNGKTYNIYTLPKEQLAECEGELVQRADDTEDAVNKRLDIYYNETAKVLDVYREQGIALEIDGEPLPEEIAKDVLSKLNIS